MSDAPRRDLIDNAPVGIVEIDLINRRFLSVNDFICRETGYSRAEFLAMDPGDLLVPEDRPRLIDRLRRTNAGETVSENVEYGIRTKSGGTRWVLLNVETAREKGKPVRARAYATDITERRNFEKALWQSQEDLDRAQVVGQIGWWRLDTRQNVLTWSDENYRIFGQPKGSPQSYETFLSIIHPDDRDLVDRRWQAGLRGEPYDIEHRIVADGRVKWVREKAYLELDPEGRLLGGFGITQDITARKLAEEALSKSEERYRALFESMTEGFALHEIVTGENGRPVDYAFIDVNPAFERLTGLRRADLIGRRVREVLPGIESNWIELYGRVALTGEPAHFENYSANLGRWYDVFAYRPGPRQFAAVFTDITERRAAQEALRQSEERLKLAQASAGAGIWDWDIPAGAIEWSEELYGLFGLDRRRVKASFEAWRDVIHPDDRKLAEDRIEDAIRLRAPLDSEYRIVRPSGEIRWIRALGNTLYDDGTPLRMSGICLDITERRRAEELRQALAEYENLRLGAAVEQASDSIVMADLDGTIRYVNAAFESINGCARAAAIGSSYFDLLAGEPDAAAIRRAVAAGRPWRGPLTRMGPDGRPIELAVTISPAMDPFGAVIGGLISEKDVTRENALQKQFRQAQKMEALGTLAGGITHDFNNILATIVINTELALLELDPLAPARQSLPLVLQAANRGKELVKQIITFSRQRTWEKKPLEIAPIVAEGLKLLRSGLPKDVAIQESVDVRSGIVLADPSHIHQVLVNLCQNASLAMKDRGGRLEVCLGPVEVDEAMAARYPNLARGRYVRLTVSDTGCGMTKDVQERIFEPFFTTRPPGEGSGLGLAVVHGIVRTYGGEITVYSEPGHGSTFNVYLPKLEREGSEGEIEDAAGPERGEERILLVEDEKAQRESIERGLTHLGYRVQARADGRSALSAFKKDPAAFDLVITDQIMPRMTGLELAGAIIALRPDMPIILCTGFSEKVNGGIMGMKGVREVLMKPYTILEISRVIRKTLSAGRDPA